MTQKTYAPTPSREVEELERKLQAEAGTKHDQAKLRMDLITPEFLEEIAKVLTFGANKYGDRNWEKGIKWGRVLGAIMRHLVAWLMGTRRDLESGLSPLSHAACNLMFLITYERRSMTKWDDLHNPISL